jgi:hypothetical protein
MSFIPEELSFIVSSDPQAGVINRTPDGSGFEVQLDGEGIQIPKDAININVSVEESTVWWVIPNIITGKNDTLYVFGDTDIATQQLFTLTVPQGLYDLAGLNQAILSGLEAQGARTDPEPLISFTPDDATQKVNVRVNYANVYVDFSPNNTPREILGFNAQQYGPYPAAPLNVLAPNTAAFNQVNHFLIHSDLVNKGIRFNNTYNQTIGQVLIDVSPGSQIVSTPYHPAKANAQELAGAKRTNLRFFLTDDKQRPVNTNGEFWTCRIVIHYMRPFIIGKGL